jgi:parallel beta-helix repeat protein
MKRVLIVISLLIVLMPALASATTYYLDVNSIGGPCNDNNPGTITQPWCTIEKANQVLQPGDTVYFRVGDYGPNAYWVSIGPVNSGTPGNYITYSRYQNEIVNLVNTNYGADLKGKSYIKIYGLRFTDVDAYWVDMRSDAPSEHNIIDSCYFADLVGDAWAGIWCGWDDVGGECNYNQILNNEFHAVCHPQNIIQFNSDAEYNIIQGNKFYYGPHEAIGFYAGDNAFGNIRYNVIKDNYVENKWHSGINVYSHSERNLIENNTIVDCGIDHLNNLCGSDRDRNQPIAHGGIQIGGPKNIIRKNKIINCGYNNMEYYSPTEAWAASGSQTYIYHNTYNRNYLGLYTSTSEGLNGTIIKNNILYNNRNYEITWDVQGTPRNNYFINNNILGAAIKFYPVGDQTLSYLQTNYPQHWQNNLEANPLFIDETNRNLRLQSTSPMIDAAAFLTKTTSAGSGTQIPVEDANYFTNGWGVVEGDIIQLEGQQITAQVVGVDYDNNFLTINISLTWASGQGVSLSYSGSAPDIGAYEFTALPSCTENDWTYSDGLCQPNNTTTRTWTKIGACEGGVTHPATETINCTYVPITYYVSTTGNDNNPGNLTHPWRTLTKAAQNAHAGNIVYFRGGVYNGQVYPTHSGNSTNYITFTAYPGEHPFFNSSSMYAVFISDQSYIEISGLKIQSRDVGGEGCGAGIVTRRAHHIRIINNEFVGSGQSGIGTVTGSDYLYIENNTIYGNCHDCYSYRGSGISLWDLGQYDDAPGYHNIIRGNLIYDNIELFGPEYSHSDANGIIIDQCYANPPVLIENNVIFNNGGRCIDVYESSNTTIVHNTCYQNLADPYTRGDAEIESGSSANVRAYNNILYARSGKGATASSYSTNIVFDYNLVFNGPDGFPGPHDITSDPLFVNPSLNPDIADFHIMSGSPAIDNASATYGPAIDYGGISRPQGSGYDIGAYEHISGQPIPGDLNNDGDVNINDLVFVSTHFGQTSSHPQWNATADVMADNEIDIYDIVFVASRFT